MGRRASLTLAACMAAAALAASAQSGGSRAVYVDGDSLAVGTGWYLGNYLRGWSLRSAVSISRHAYEGAYAVRARGAALEHVLVLDLGTNDDPSAVSSFAGYVREIVRAAGPSRCVIWSTVNRPPYNGISYEGYNSVLRQLDRRYASLHVFDWAAMARANPQWFGADGVHPSGTGYRSRASALARLIKSC